MNSPVLHLLAGLAGYELVYLAAARCCGERAWAVPFFVFPMGAACALGAPWYGWAGTGSLIGMFAVLAACEVARVRRFGSRSPPVVQTAPLETLQVPFASARQQKTRTQNFNTSGAGQRDSNCGSSGDGH